MAAAFLGIAVVSVAVGVAPAAAQGSAQIGMALLDATIAPTVAVEWTWPLGRLRPAPDGGDRLHLPGPRRVQIRPWALVASLGAGPALDLEAHAVSAAALAALGIQRRVTSRWSLGVGVHSAAGLQSHTPRVGAHLHLDLLGIVGVRVGTLDGPFAALQIGWATVRDVLGSPVHRLKSASGR